MSRIEIPRMNTLNFTVNDVFLKGDDVSVNQYCLENGYDLDNYVLESQRFSNDGGLLYNYYDAVKAEWKTEFGFSKVVAILNTI